MHRDEHDEVVRVCCGVRSAVAVNFNALRRLTFVESWRVPTAPRGESAGVAVRDTIYQGGGCAVVEQ
jgi:hypothetical protein